MYSPLAFSIALCALVLLTPTSNANSTKRSTARPIMNGVSFPDPAVIKTNDGWHLFSTNAKVDGKLVHIQRGFTKDWKTFQFRRGVDALPNLPAWVDGVPRVWAPDVVQTPSGFVMYYTAAYKKMPRLHCLGFATAKRITDPFVDTSSEPWICPTKQGGAIDVAGFTDERNGGKRYVVYKIDGNASGHGGACGNTVKPIVPTPILLQEVSKKDGTTLIGRPKQILTNGPGDGPYVEAPTVTYMGGKYVLFFSSQCYQTDGYDVQYAVADKITGPYTRKGRLFGTGDYGMKAPGGLDIAINGVRAVWHGYVNPYNETKSDGMRRQCKTFERKVDCKARDHANGRAAYVATLSFKNGAVQANAVSGTS